MTTEMTFKNLVANYTEVKAEEMKNDMRFREDLNFSSLDFMSLLGESEDEFDVELEEEEVMNLHTIGDALELIERIA